MVELIAVDETVKLTWGQMRDASQTVLQRGTRVYTRYIMRFKVMHRA